MLVSPEIKYLLREFEKLFKLGLLVMHRGSSFHSLGPEKITKRLSDSSLDIELVKLVRSLLRKFFDKLSGRSSLCNLHINFAYFSSIDFSRGRIFNSLFELN